jgi:hypothetical protein
MISSILYDLSTDPTMATTSPPGCEKEGDCLVRIYHWPNNEVTLEHPVSLLNRICRNGVWRYKDDPLFQAGSADGHWKMQFARNVVNEYDWPSFKRDLDTLNPFMDDKNPFIAHLFVTFPRALVELIGNYFILDGIMIQTAHLLVPPSVLFGSCPAASTTAGTHASAARTNNTADDGVARKKHIQQSTSKTAVSLFDWYHSCCRRAHQE